MKVRAYKMMMIVSSGILLGILPGCLEEVLLNVASPFLLQW
jgi:hypothetical protein